MRKVLFCQFSNTLLNKDYKRTLSDKYYQSIYKLKDREGYYKDDNFFELPLWIAEASGALKGYNKALHIIRDIKASIDYLNGIETDYILFSVLDINKDYILNIIKNYTGKARFLLGGYVDFKDFRCLDNVIILKDIKELCKYLKIDYVYDLDYSLFKDYKTIPRLTLSKGCLNRCRFCTVKKIIEAINYNDIIKQVKSFRSLDFKLVYINDKSLGQCSNYILLDKLYHIIKSYNKNFQGFIIQTTASKILNKNFIDNLKGLHIFACELGIETYNNSLLKGLNKPQNTDTIDKAISILKSLDIKIIGNFIIGIIGENKNSYNNTLNFIDKNKKDFYILNIYNLAIYKDSLLSESIKTKNIDDLNENKIEKSFYTDTQNKDNLYFYNKIFKIGLEILHND